MELHVSVVGCTSMLVKLFLGLKRNLTGFALVFFLGHIPFVPRGKVSR